MADRSAFEKLEEIIESSIDHCREAGIVVCDYQPSVSFPRKFNDLVYKLQALDRMRPHLQQAYVPASLCVKIDAGQNPQLYTRDRMEATLSKNEAVRGKLDALARFRALLLAQLSHDFPNEMAKYRTASANGGGGESVPGGANDHLADALPNTPSSSQPPGGSMFR